MELVLKLVKKYQAIALGSAVFLAACGGSDGSSGSTALTRSNTTDAKAALNDSTSTAELAEQFNSADAIPVTASAKAGNSGAVSGLRKVARSSGHTAVIQTISLGAPETEKMTSLQDRNKATTNGVQPKSRITGFARDVAATSTAQGTQGQLEWTRTASGTQRAIIGFESTSARALRVGLLVTQLPGNAVVRTYGESATDALETDGQFINEAIARNLAADGDKPSSRTYWLPTSMGSIGFVEIELPSNAATSAVQVAIPRVMHILETSLDVIQKDMVAKSECPATTPDATCSLPPALEAVASYDFAIDGGLFSGSCTGTLIADKAGSAANYLLTANHCVDTQTEASSLQLYWDYRSATCNGDTLNPSFQQTAGANLLFGQSVISPSTRNQTGTDTTLLQLTQSPPSGTLKAGWLATPQAPSNTNLIGLHHPAAASTPTQYWARRSDGQVTQYGISLQTNQVIPSPDPSLPLYEVAWTTGITEGGSSGSALFLDAMTSNPKVIGQLWGGSSHCQFPQGKDYYGRLDLGYQDGMINWLNPGFRAVFRFYNSVSGTHFYSGNVQERNTIRQNIPSYQHEGVAYMVATGPSGGALPVYRFYRPAAGVHFYTINESEKNATMNLPGYSYEGPAWYARSTSATGTVPIFRFHRPATGTHLYTSNTAERDNLIATRAQEYTYEGVAYYAWPYN